MTAGEIIIAILILAAFTSRRGKSRRMSFTNPPPDTDPPINPPTKTGTKTP